MTRLLRIAFLFALGLALPLAARAADDAWDLTLYRQGETYLKPTIVLEGGAFSESQAWLGKSREVIGDHVGYWYEYAVTGGLEGALALGESGLLYARASAIGSGSDGLDAAGSDFDDRYPGKLEVEDLYLGWRSGKLFSGLDENALDISVGKQKYQIGSGFFMWDGASDGGKRGAYWIGPRKAFYSSAVVRFHTGPYKVEAFYLKPNDEPYTSTKLAGANFEYKAGDTGTLGVTYMNIYHSARESRDGLNFWDWRLSLTPIASDRNFALSGEYALELNGNSRNSSAWYGEAGYTFADATWSPLLSYRYSWFQGDDPDTADAEVYDPLFYGFYDWSTWYVGEIIGEFVTLNADLGMHTVRFTVHPTESLTMNLIYNYYYLLETTNEIAARDLGFNPRAVDIHSKHIGQGLDLIADWTANSHLSFSGVVAAFQPGAAAQQFVGGNTSQWWMHFMFYTKVSF